MCNINTFKLSGEWKRTIENIYLVNLVCLNRFSTKFNDIEDLTFGIEFTERSWSEDCLRFEFTAFTGGHCLDPLADLFPDFLINNTICMSTSLMDST